MKTRLTPQERGQKAGEAAHTLDSLLRQIYRRRDQLESHHLAILRGLGDAEPVSTDEEMSMHRVLLGRRS